MPESEFDEIEFEDVLKSCKELYGEQLNENELNSMANHIISLDFHQNKAYEIANKICLMVENPSVYKEIMEQHRKMKK